MALSGAVQHFFWGRDRSGVNFRQQKPTTHETCPAPAAYFEWLPDRLRATDPEASPPWKELDGITGKPLAAEAGARSSRKR